MRDVLRGSHPAHGNPLDEGFLPLRSPAFPLRLVVRTGAQEPGRDGIHRDAELPESWESWRTSPSCPCLADA